MSLIEKISSIVPRGDVLVGKEEQAYASADQSTNVQASWPYLVVRVNTQAELIDVARACIAHSTPIVMRGAGSGKSGGAVGNAASVVIDVTRLNRIISIDTASMLAVLEPGVVLSDFQDAVQAYGLYYPPDPASRTICTIGGNVAENAAGPSTLKYGTTRDYLLGGQALLGTGELIDFGKYCPKGVTGYDIASLLCGSEGTLAILTKLVMRLIPLPKDQAASMLFFADGDQALSAVNAIFSAGHLPKTLEYVDRHCLAALDQLVSLTSPKEAQAALIIECDASYAGGAKEALADLEETIASYSLIAKEVANTESELSALWTRRSRLSEACSRYRGHKLSEDIAVPLGKIAEFGRAINKLSPDPSIVCGIFGHAGDGNLHVQIMFPNATFEKMAQSLRHEVLLLVLSLGGTLTAEHGIGLQKKAYLALEQSPDLIALQKRIKHAFDPHNLLNPGKIFDV